MNKRLLFLSLLIASDSWAESPIHNDSSTLCNTTTEQIIFSCPIVTTKKINKTLSVCGSLPTIKDAYVEYRFGRKNKIELSYQASKHYPNHQIYLNQVELQVGQHDTIYFKNNNIGYRLSINRDNQGLKKTAALSIYTIHSDGYKIEQEKLAIMCDGSVQESFIRKTQEISFLTPQTEGQLHDWIGD